MPVVNSTFNPERRRRASSRSGIRRRAPLNASRARRTSAVGKDGCQWRGLCPAFVNFAPQNIPYGRTIRPPTLVDCSNAAPGRAVCVLGRFLPKLGSAASTAIFFLVAGTGKRRPVWTLRDPWLALVVSQAMAKRSPLSAFTPAVLRAQAERIRTRAKALEQQNESAEIDAAVANIRTALPLAEALSTVTFAS